MGPVELDWMMLANYAEAPPESGVIYITGGGIDTITVHAPLEGAPEGMVAVAHMHLAIRLLFHVTELGRDRSFDITVMDEDGGLVGKIEGGLQPERPPNLPPGWPHGVHLVFPLVGMPLPRFGLFTIGLQIDGNHLGETRFRVVQGY